MAKKNKHALSEVEGVVESQEPVVSEANPSAVSSQETKDASLVPACAGTADRPRPSSLRYAGKTIKHFEHEGKAYQLMPNSVYLNLPADAEQVKRLIAVGELKEVE